ncbi:ComF family protein [Mammaliicoccus sp. Dog046]|uniref:ComF family protein n=1 Tax=Mammaliicoccus sp. Dog046 TaxID=3034233 RepID=UPI002B26283A|nr:phosphoribosyltransferase family protein [Mammaliicoccus sp. Dog046]WQK85002.1 phosphoribosyltransferase family protein [Mammaliicoccus sp. Dog046]
MKYCLVCQNPIREVITLVNFYAKSSIICETCKAEFEFNQDVRRCQRCLKVLGKNEEACLDCQWLSQRYTLINQLYTLYDYQGIVKEVIHQYKLMGDVALGQIFQLPPKLIKQYDYIIPAPIHPSKKTIRTFDHVSYVLECNNIKFTEIFTTAERRKQSELTKMERAKQLNPFQISKEIDLENKRILLVDDIYTTGLTIHQLAELLYVRKIRILDSLTFARG